MAELEIVTIRTCKRRLTLILLINFYFRENTVIPKGFTVLSMKQLYKLLLVALSITQVQTLDPVTATVGGVIGVGALTGEIKIFFLLIRLLLKCIFYPKYYFNNFCSEFHTFLILNETLNQNL